MVRWARLVFVGRFRVNILQNNSGSNNIIFYYISYFNIFVYRNTREHRWEPNSWMFRLARAVRTCTVQIDETRIRRVRNAHSDERFNATVGGAIHDIISAVRFSVKTITVCVQPAACKRTPCYVYRHECLKRKNRSMGEGKKPCWCEAQNTGRRIPY